MSEPIEDLVGAAVETVGGLESLGEAIDDAWTYVTDLAAAQRRRLDEIADRRAGERLATDRAAAIRLAIEEAGRIADPHRAIDWLSTFPDIVALALDEPIGGPASRPPAA